MVRAAPPAPPAPPPPTLPPATMDPATMAPATMDPATMAPATMAPGYEQPQPIQYEQTQPPALTAGPEPVSAVTAVPGAAMTTPAADVMTQLQQGLAAATAPEAATAAGAAVPMQQYTLATLMPGMGGQYVLAPASAYYGAAAAPGANNAALQQYIAAAYPTLDATQQAALVQYYSQLQVASAQASGGLGGLATVISGGYPVVATTGPSNAWITNRLIEREKARIEKNYEEADKLRKLLRQNGIEVDDRDRSWTSRDGRRGPRPNHNDPMEEENEAATLVSAMPGLLSGLGAVPAASA